MFNDSMEGMQILEGSKVSSGCRCHRVSIDDCLHSGNISKLDYYLLFDMWHAYLYNKCNRNITQYFRGADSIKGSMCFLMLEVQCGASREGSPIGLTVQTGKLRPGKGAADGASTFQAKTLH